MNLGVPCEARSLTVAALFQRELAHGRSVPVTVPEAHSKPSERSSRHFPTPTLFLAPTLAALPLMAAGGEIVDAKTTAPGEVRGSAIKGGKTKTLKAGGTVNIPPMTPHHVTIEAGKSVTYMIVKENK